MDTSLSTPRITSRTRAGTVLALLALAPVAFASPVFAQSPHGGGGGGHSSAPASHASGGGHTFAARPSGGASSGGYGGGYHTNANYAPAHISYSPAHVNYAPARAVSVNTTVTRGGANVAHVAPAYRAGGGYGYAGGAHLAPGRYVPGSAFRYGHWNGGYWNGGFWPPVFWGANFAWFLPVIPAFAATYYWNSIPYYYYNDVYYTYDPSASGYVVTTPPPAQDAGPDTPAPSAQQPDDSNSGAIASGAPANSGTGSLYAYPRNGQSDEQQSTDRQECARWASGQTGSDGTGTSMDYQRALTACLQGRGYSVD